jgi:transketolase
METYVSSMKYPVLTDELKKVAAEVRKQILLMSYRAQSAHTGGALSCVELLTVLYFRFMHIDPKKPWAQDRDRLVFSKAHDAKALYAVLAERGFFDRKILLGYEQNHGLLAGHSIRHSVPGIEVSAGSLGHGLSMATGMALAGKIDRKKWRVFAVLSDGECDEGSVWEAALFAGHHKLDNLIVLVDYNGLQGYGRTKDVLNLEPFAAKWRAFGWQTRDVDGHNMEELSTVLKKTPFLITKPSVIIAHTIKGFGGVEKYIDQVSSQYKPPTKEEYDEAVKKLELV